MTSEAGPGASRVKVWRRMSRKWVWWRAVASPTTAITPGSIVRVIWNASARTWLNPSA